MKTTLPAGRYWIGDPCYYVDDERWMEVCDQSFKPGVVHTDAVWIELEDLQFLLIGTAHGDGGYGLMKNGVEIAILGVDSGCLSIIPTKAPLGENLGGYVVEIEKPFIVNASGGNFTFGDYKVDTDEDDYDWEDEYEEEDDYDFWEDEKDI